MFHSSRTTINGILHSFSTTTYRVLYSSSIVTIHHSIISTIVVILDSSHTIIVSTLQSSTSTSDTDLCSYCTAAILRNAYFEGSSRFGHLSSNTDEFHKWILDAHELPIIQVVESIHNRLIQEFKERQEMGSAWTCVLAPSAEKLLLEAIQSAASYQVLRSDEVEFEVLSADRSHIVNIGTHSCSCRDWQLYGIPCSQAVAALISCKKDVYEYTDKYFTVASYIKTYSHAINPLTCKSEWTKRTEFQAAAAAVDEMGNVRPPKFHRPPGRPEKKRLCVEESNREKHTVHCSRCNQTGHYKRTCKADVIPAIEQ